MSAVLVYSLHLHPAFHPWRGQVDVSEAKEPVAGLRMPDFRQLHTDTQHNTMAIVTEVVRI